MFGLSFWEIGLVVLVALVVLGPKRLPALARTIGSGLRTLRRASSDVRQALEEPLREVREPLEEMRREIYDTVHHFEGEVDKRMREIEDTVANSGEDGSSRLADDDPYALAAAEEAEDEALPSLADAEGLDEADETGLDGDDGDDLPDTALAAELPEEEEDGRVASTDPFAPAAEDPDHDVDGAASEAQEADTSIDGITAGPSPELAESTASESAENGGGRGQEKTTAA